MQDLERIEQRKIRLNGKKNKERPEIIALKPYSAFKPPNKTLNYETVLASSLAFLIQMVEGRTEVFESSHHDSDVQSGIKLGLRRRRNGVQKACYFYWGNLQKAQALW